MSCDHCPCPESCLRWPVWCAEWAPSGDPILLAHIRHRSEHGPARPAPPVAGAPPVAVSVELTRRMNACPDRSTEGCGCAGAKCGRRGGAIVSHRDCFACLGRRQGEP